MVTRVRIAVVLQLADDIWRLYWTTAVVSQPLTAGEDLVLLIPLLRVHIYRFLILVTSLLRLGVYLVLIVHL